MHTFLERQITSKITQKLANNPVVALLGPRQCGKSTLAKKIISHLKPAIYLDLELPSDQNKLTNPQSFFQFNQNQLICIDEIQRQPELFPIIRAVVDQQNKNQQFLLLGSASQELLQQSSESLAGRIAYLELTPFNTQELTLQSTLDVRMLLQRGGFPRSYLAVNEQESYEWRHNFIRTFLEQDIPALGINIDTHRLRRFWMMCAHISGQLLNASKLGESLGVSHHTIRSYLELLSKTFILRILPPLEANLKKRLVKSPKILLRDTGLLNTLLEIENPNQLMGHPNYGHIWESFAIEQILSQYTQWRPYFYRDSNGGEIDLILEKGQERLALEFKTHSNPSISASALKIIDELNISKLHLIIPEHGSHYPLNDKTDVLGLTDFLNRRTTTL